MIDRTIPYYNILMAYRGGCVESVRLPEDVALRMYQPGDEHAWARMECAVGDFESESAALKYFSERFLSDRAALAQRMTLAVDSTGTVVGSCLAWRNTDAKEPFSLLHWLVVDPACQGKGIGRALCVRTLEVFRELGESPIYLHTQPWSHKAVRLYNSVGFRMMKGKTPFACENQYEQAMAALKPLLAQDVFSRLEASAEESMEDCMEKTKEWLALERIAQEMEKIPGHTGFYYKNLVSGLEFGVREGEAFGAASVIKLPLFMHVLKESAEGRLSMEERLTVTKEDKVPICGALTLFTDDVACDVRTLCRLMISISDNTATNRLIDYATIPGASAGFEAMGLHVTRLTRKLFDREASRKGLRNVICPKEIGALLEMLWRGEFVSKAVSKEAIDTLLLQQVDHKLNGKICGEVAIAHKTGEDDELSNDVGVVYAKEPFVICFAGHDTDVYAWEDLMRRGTYALLRAQDEE